MFLHWPSFLIGLATPVAALLLVLLVARGLGYRRTRGTSYGSTPARASAAGFEPLRFNPRLFGKIRRTIENDEHEQAS